MCKTANRNCSVFCCFCMDWLCTSFLQKKNHIGAFHLAQMQCKHDIHMGLTFNVIASSLVLNIDQMICNALIFQPIVWHFKKCDLASCACNDELKNSFHKYQLKRCCICLHGSCMFCFHKISNKLTQVQKHMYDGQMTQ